MNRGEITVILVLAAGSILLLALLFSPLLVVYLHYRSKRKRRAMLQIKYDAAILAIKEQLEQCLMEGLAVSLEVWELPPADPMADLFFELLEKSAVRLVKSVFLPTGKLNSLIATAECRLLRFQRAGLLSDTRNENGKGWTIKLREVGDTTVFPSHTIDLWNIMATASELHQELTLTNS